MGGVVEFRCVRALAEQRDNKAVAEQLIDGLGPEAGYRIGYLALLKGGGSFGLLPPYLHQPRMSSSFGTRPLGVYWSTAFGNSRERRVSSSSRDRPVCCSSSSRTSGPIACSRSRGATFLLGPVPTQESTRARHQL